MLVLGVPSAESPVFFAAVVVIVVVIQSPRLHRFARDARPLGAFQRRSRTDQ